MECKEKHHTKIKTTCILILSHLLPSFFTYSPLFTCSNDYEDCYIDLFCHGPITTTRSFSPLQRHPNSEGWLQLDEDFSRFQPLIYRGCYFHNVKNHGHQVSKQYSQRGCINCFIQFSAMYSHSENRKDTIY